MSSMSLMSKYHEELPSGRFFATQHLWTGRDTADMNDMDDVILSLRCHPCHRCLLTRKDFNLAAFLLQSIFGLAETQQT